MKNRKGRLTTSYCNSIFPAAILDRSRISLINPSKVCPLLEIAPQNRLCFSLEYIELVKAK
jgi:hypothetical protein